MTAAALVAPLLLAACDTGGGSGADQAPRTTTAAPEEPQLSAPTNLRVKAGTFRATLRWDPATSTEPVTDYDIYRNGRLLTSVGGTVTRWVDNTVQPRRKYRWQVRAKAGELEEASELVSARMKVPPLAAAQLEGDFDVRLTIESHYGYASLGSGRSLGIRFNPKCLQGLCRRVEWRNVHERKVRGVLVRQGARYTGTYTGPYNSNCGGTIRTSYVQLEFVVKKARAISGRWHATRLRGQIKVSESAGLGCVSSGMTQSIRGRLYASSL